jgi:hypothetical protein
MIRQVARRVGVGLIASLLALGLAHIGLAKQVGGAGGAGGTGGTGGTGGGQTQSSAGGIEIDAEGVLRTKSVVDPLGRLADQRKAAARAILSQDVMRSSPLRKISLNRLEREVEALRVAGKPINEEMLHLAGLTRITHLFYLPESRDIVLAGPAEGFFADPAGRVIGMETGQAILQLQDLIVALRAFAPGSPGTSMISCSIDPTADGLIRLREAQEQVQAVASSGRHPNSLEVVRAFRQALGMNEVTIKGVSPKTHFAQVMTEADYRMKLIGIGLEQPAVPMTTFIAKADVNNVAKNALLRWYFQPNYDCVHVSADGTAMQLVGTGVKLVGEDERIGADGQRSGTKKSNRASQAFCESFTEKFGALAKVAPVFAELRNLMDLSIAAAYIHEKDWYQQSGWTAAFFGDESRSTVESNPAVRLVEPAVNVIEKGNVTGYPMGGGVTIQPRIALSSEHLKVDTSGEIQKAKADVKIDGLGESQWWWD